MFSSNPFPVVPSSPNVLFPPNSLFDHEKDCGCFSYNINNSNPFISDDCFYDTYRSLASPSPVKENITTIEQDFYIQQQQFSEGLGLQSSEDHDDLLESVISRFKKKTKASSKDGHSKIYTARGPRDRRVRLSIDISRKFFSLQDMLGFDKASKTLDWLLAKSKTAIKELVEETNHCFPSTPTYQSKLNFLESIMEGVDGHNRKKKSVLKYGDGKRKKTTQKAKEGFQGDTARGESRAIARARARERARVKMQFRKLDDELKTLGHDEIDNQNLKTSTGETHRVISTYPAAW